MSIREYIGEVVEGMVESRTESLADDLLPILIEQGLLAESTTTVPENFDFVGMIESHAPNRTITLVSDGVVDDEDYLQLFHEFVATAQLEKEISQVETVLDGEELMISCSVKGDTFRTSWTQSNDRISASFMAYINRVFGENFNLTPVIISDDGEGATLVFLKSEGAAKAQDFFNRIRGEIDPDEVSGFKIMLTIAGCVVGAICTTLIGWPFVGFWMPLLCSIITWPVIGLFTSIALVRKQEQEEQAMQVLADNPEMMVKMMQEMLPEVAANKTTTKA